MLYQLGRGRRGGGGGERMANQIISDEGRYSIFFLSLINMTGENLNPMTPGSVTLNRFYSV